MLLVLECVAIVRYLRSDDSDPQSAAPTVLPLLAPVDLPERGSLVLSEIRADGSVEVSQWLRDGDGIDELSLAAPVMNGRTGSIRATDGRLVAADGTVIADDLTIGAESRLVRFDDSTTMLRATYVLRGVVERSATVTGRLSARVVSLDADLSALSGPTVVVVEVEAGGEVRGLACANARSAVELLRPCGTPDGSRWRVRLDPVSREDRVAAVVDLP
ncbi:hypothetical protein GCM10023350_10670 [Nocardioides endophyticus]|uniref:Uncharacterized protein n=1 Tax=Nocardioides endophyticus TaxID=1353775 RepID=A0ABP8YG65_9ACTN